jgi:hypothetical protein
MTSLSNAPGTPKNAASLRQNKSKPSPFKNVTSSADNKLQIGLGNSFSYGHMETRSGSHKRPDFSSEFVRSNREHTEEQIYTEENIQTVMTSITDDINVPLDLSINLSSALVDDDASTSRKRLVKTANNKTTLRTTQFMPTQLDTAEQHRLIYVAPQRIVPTPQSRNTSKSFIKRNSMLTNTTKNAQEEKPVPVDNILETQVEAQNHDIESDLDDSDDDISDGESSSGDEVADDEGEAGNDVLYNKDEAEIYRYRIEPPKKVLKIEAQPNENTTELRNPKPRTIYSAEKSRKLAQTRQLHKNAKQMAGQGDEIRDISYMIESSMEANNKKYVEKIAHRNYKNSIKHSLRMWDNDTEQEEAAKGPKDSNDLTESFNEDIQQGMMRRLRLPNIGKKTATAIPGDRSFKVKSQMKQPPKTAAPANNSNNNPEEDFLVDEVLKAVGKKDLRIPASQIPKEFYIIENTPIVTKDDLAREAQYNPEKGIWETKIFPSNKPTSRVEVMHLARTCETMLRAVKQQT